MNRNNSAGAEARPWRSALQGRLATANACVGGAYARRGLVPWRVRNQYMRTWRRNNPDKVRAQQERYWQRKGEEMLRRLQKEQQA